MTIDHNAAAEIHIDNHELKSYHHHETPFHHHIHIHTYTHTHTQQFIHHSPDVLLGPKDGAAERGAHKGLRVQHVEENLRRLVVNLLCVGGEEEGEVKERN